MSYRSEFFGSYKTSRDALNCCGGSGAQNTVPSAGRDSETWERQLKQREGVDNWDSSAEWLEENCLERRGLTLPHLFSLCPTASVCQTGDGVCAQQEITAETLSDFETQLYQALELYHSRIQWLTQLSRKRFGVVKGCRLGVLIDSSDWICSEEKLADLQHHLLLLTEEQFHTKQQLHFLSFGSDITSLWDQPKDATRLRLREAQQWFLQLRPRGGCNLLQALEEAWGLVQLDALLLVLGSRPDQAPDAVVNYITQQRALSVHAVAYDCCSFHAVDTVKNIAKVTGGRYHLYSAALGVVDSSSDLELLWAEIKAATNVLQHVQDMLYGRVRDAPSSSLSGLMLKQTPTQRPAEAEQISAELDSLSLTSESCKSCGGDGVELCIQPRGPLPVTSVDWLRSHGLKAKKLELYQVLAPNVYTPLEGFIPILGKSVHSTVHERAMVQFKWHDGKTRSVHVDLPLLKNYQRRLLEAERVLEDRADWLSSTASRQIWGTVCEQRVQVLLDMCGMSAPYQLHMRHAVRLLLQEQLPSTHGFSVTAFGSDVKSWRDHMAPPTQENLQEVWQWVQGLQCGGGRNTLNALRHTLEVELIGDSALTRGLYLLTTGVPDECAELVSDYTSAACRRSGIRLHVCLLGREEGPTCCHDAWTETATVLRNLAHATHGRFHWITDTGIVESDDVIVLIEELKKTADYWQKCCELIDSLVRRSSSGDPGVGPPPECCSPVSGPQARARRPRLSPPRPTRLSMARLGGDATETKEGKQSPAWRPNSAKAVIPAALIWEAARPVQSGKHRKVTCSHSVFYLENGSLGAVFRTYLQPKSAPKSRGTAKLPKQEDVCSSKQWLKRFGIRSLNLDLHKLVFGPECTHRQTLVPAVQKSVSAKHCAIFPSVQLNGRLRHLFVSPGELKQYLLQTERLLRRYVRRTQWLLSGSRRVFGCVLEQAVCLVLDLSGSMASGFHGLRKELPALIWEQLHAKGVRFSMVAFSGEVRVWQAELVEATETRCREAVQWSGQLNTHGSTSILQALQACCVFGGPLGVYVVSDGKPDCSCRQALSEAERMTAGTSVTIHTVTLSALDSTARDFLKSLAHRTGGRFHQMPSHADTQAANQLLAQGFKEREDAVLPAFEGDDLRRLKDEIEKLRMFQNQAKTFRKIILEKYPEVTEPNK